jgi:hypothetical protein
VEHVMTAMAKITPTRVATPAMTYSTMSESMASHPPSYG